MSGSMQVLREELQLSHEQAQLMDIVLRESERLEPDDPIVPRLRAASAVRDHAGSTSAAWCATRRCCCATAPTRATRTSSRLTFPSEPVWHDADENQIRQVVWNLATNRLRAMADGGASTLSVRRVPGASGEEVLLTVSRRGLRHPRRRDRRHLPAVPQFVRARHGPRARHRPPHRHRQQRPHRGVVPLVGTGPTMRVHLPTREQEDAAAHAVPVAAAKVPRMTPQAASHRRAAAGDLEGSRDRRSRGAARRVLIVDDEPSMREMLSIVLRRDGYDVRVAENGRSAIQLLQK